ncbi:MFS transporter [Nonomuraea aurantiaca]|uniref:MFS transporter n=1 Tax=Nonomuraea aurantiaca TaxID=2878562 RepID=UPI001CD98714|nr:MFS transporter [Nonomuraea aurantiaca]MCA2230013.1 MFS transporter [Nonomuraea aurantiaca]
MSTLIGIAIAERRITSVDDPVTRYLPELARREAGFGRITLRHLLTEMRSHSRSRKALTSAPIRAAGAKTFPIVACSRTLQAGLEILPLTIFIPVSNIVFARVSGRAAAGPLLAVSFLVAGAASLALVALSPSTPYWMLAVALGLTGIAGGFISPAMTAATVNAAGTRHANTAGSVLNANRQIGSLVGIASIGAVLAVTPGWTAGAALSFLLVGTAYIAGALIAWRLIHLPERRQTTATTGPVPKPQPRHGRAVSWPDRSPSEHGISTC